MVEAGKVPITFITGNKKKLEDFREFANTLKQRAVGLATNQCEVNGKRMMLRAFAKKVDVYQMSSDFMIIIDPVITSTKGMPRIVEEGCLTWDVEKYKIAAERYPEITVSYYSMDGVKRSKTVNGFEAQVWQHEIDHLNGVEEHILPIGAPKPATKKIHRNDPCYCGSGKKFKKCCM